VVRLVIKKGSEEYKQLNRKIKGLRAYKDRIKQIPEALRLQKGEGLKSNVSKSTVQYVYYNSSDDLFKRLELLCAERDIGNDSIEVRNEISSILDELLKQDEINPKEHKLLYNKWFY
jgi:hypothetical protein